MENYRCSMDNCSETPKILCSCQEPPFQLCERHMTSHFATENRGDHNIRSIFDPLDSRETSILQETKARLFEMKDRSTSKIFQRYFTKIQKINEQFSEHMSAVGTFFDNLIARIDESLRLNLALRSKKDDDFLLNLKALSETAHNNREEELDKFILGFLDPLPPYVRSIFHISDIKEERFNYCFKANTKNLIEVDNDKLTKISIAIDDLPENLGRYAGHCSLEDASIFYCGGEASQTITSCYKIDPNNKTVLKRADLPIPLQWIIPTRIENEIYVFGGNNSNEYIPQSYKYLIQEDRWERIDSLPNNACLSSSVALNKSILLVGYYLNGIYEYKNNNYYKIKSCDSRYNLLLKNKEGELFLLSGSFIYKSSVYDYHNWKVKGSFNPAYITYVENTPQLWGDYFCYQILGNRYITFNYKTLQFQEPAID